MSMTILPGWDFREGHTTESVAPVSVLVPRIEGDGVSGFLCCGAQLTSDVQGQGMIEQLAIHLDDFPFDMCRGPRVLAYDIDGYERGPQYLVISVSEQDEYGQFEIL